MPIVATFVAADGRSAELLTILREAAMAARSEEGCLSYALYRDRSSTTRFVIIEYWESLSALEKHGSQPHVRAMSESLRAPGLLSAKPSVLMLDPDSSTAKESEEL